MKGQRHFAAELQGEKGDPHGKTAKEIPGIHEAEGDTGTSTYSGQRANTSVVLSLVSPLDGPGGSGSASSAVRAQGGSKDGGMVQS